MNFYKYPQHIRISLLNNYANAYLMYLLKTLILSFQFQNSKIR